jgi:hypothetical protein
VKIACFFAYPEAKVQIEHEWYHAWIIVAKGG